MRERLLDVAFGVLVADLQVALAAAGNGLLGRVLEGVFLLHQEIKDFVFGLDGVQGVEHVFFGIGGEADDLVAGVVQLLADLGDDEDCLDAGHLLGFGSVEALEAWHARRDSGESARAASPGG